MLRLGGGGVEREAAVVVLVLVLVVVLWWLGSTSLLLTSMVMVCKFKLYIIESSCGDAISSLLGYELGYVLVAFSGSIEARRYRYRTGMDGTSDHGFYAEFDVSFDLV